MADNIRFEGNAMQIINKMNDEFAVFLEEASGELEAQTKRNTPVGRVAGGGTKEKWTHEVDEGNLEAVVGNTQETAIWIEFGTGDYALEGKGRKGGWWILIGEGSGMISQNVVDAYGFKIGYGSNGKKYAFTRGMKPKRPLYNAKESTKGKIQRRFQQICKELGD